MSSMVINGITYSVGSQKTKNHSRAHWYSKQKDPDTGTWGNRKSIDSLAKKLGEIGHIDNKEDAEDILRRAVEAGLVEGDFARLQDPVLSEFLVDYWDFDRSVYLMRENKLNPGSIGKDHAHNSQRNILNHVLPYLPANLKCSQLKRRHVEAVQLAILEKYSVSVWKNTKTALRKPVEELLRQHILVSDPFSGIADMKQSRIPAAPKGALDLEETNLLLSQMRKRKSCCIKRKIYKEGKCVTVVSDILDARVYLAFALSSITGMRESEVLALRTSCIKIYDNGQDVAVLSVRESVGRKAGFKLPKNKRERKVPVPLWLAKELLDFGKTNPWGGELIFYSNTNSDMPVRHTVLCNGFDKEVELFLGARELGFETDAVLSSQAVYDEVMKKGKEIRKNRGITYHSTRRFFDTQSFNLVGGESTRVVMGHSSENMTRLYYVSSDSEILRIGAKTTKIIDPQ